MGNVWSIFKDCLIERYKGIFNQSEAEKMANYFQDALGRELALFPQETVDSCILSLL